MEGVAILFLLIAMVVLAASAPLAVEGVVWSIVLSLGDWLAAGRRRRLDEVPHVVRPIVASRRSDGLIHDERGPLTFAAPIRIWRASWRDRFRKHAVLEINGVLRERPAIGSYRERALDGVIAPPPGAAFVDVFVGERRIVEHAVSGVFCTPFTVRCTAWLVFVALASVAVLAACLASLGPICAG